MSAGFCQARRNLVLAAFMLLSVAACATTPSTQEGIAPPVIVPSGVPHQFVDITAPVQVMSIYLPNVSQ